MHAAEIGGIDRFEPDEDPASATSGNQVQEFFVFQKIDADLGNPGEHGILRNDVVKQRLRPFDVDGKVVVDEKDSDGSAFTPCSLLEAKQFINNALVRSKANRIAKKTGDGAEIATVRTASAGLNRDYVKT